jgi:hypothetical protein
MTATPTAPSPASQAPAEEASEAALQVAVKAYSDAFLTGDPAAYDLLSGRCQERLSRSRFTAMVAAAKQLYGSALPFTSYVAKASGDMARVTYTYDVSAINQSREPWVFENGAWREDDC